MRAVLSPVAALGIGTKPTPAAHRLSALGSWRKSNQWHTIQSANRRLATELANSQGRERERGGR
ncbi:hypothetical protein LY76DRAFT_236871 [Colletotrichum caudatum]|nr:hypothetical protein LY76DRAFT_236871 [Colletotrichum caudatum]